MKPVHNPDKQIEILEDINLLPMYPVREDLSPYELYQQELKEEFFRNHKDEFKTEQE